MPPYNQHCVPHSHKHSVSLTFCHTYAVDRVITVIKVDLELIQVGHTITLGFNYSLHEGHLIK